MSNLLKDVFLVLKSEEDWALTKSHFIFKKIIEHPKREVQIHALEDLHGKTVRIIFKKGSVSRNTLIKLQESLPFQFLSPETPDSPDEKMDEEISDKGEVTDEEVEDEDVSDIVSELEDLQTQKKALDEFEDTLKKKLFQLESIIDPSLVSFELENISTADKNKIHFSEDVAPEQDNKMRFEKKLGKTVMPSNPIQKDSEQSLALFQQFYRTIRSSLPSDIPKELHESVQKALGVGLTPPSSDAGN